MDQTVLEGMAPKARNKVFLDAPLAPGQSKDPYVPRKLTKGDVVENIWSIWFAAREGDVERVARLLDRDENASMNQTDLSEKRTPLHWACRGGSTRVVKLLLDRGAQINVRDSQGNTPLHYCCGYGTEAMLRILMNDLRLDPLVQNNNRKVPAEVGRALGKPHLSRVLEAYCKAQGKSVKHSHYSEVNMEPVEVLEARAASRNAKARELAAKAPPRSADPLETQLRKQLAILQMRERSNGDSDVTLVPTLSKIGDLCNRLGRHDEAVQHLLRAHSIMDSKDISGVDYAAICNNAAEALYKQGEFERAVELFEAAYRELLDVSNSDASDAIENIVVTEPGQTGSLEMALTLRNLALALSKCQRFKDAITCMFRAVKISVARYGSTHHKTADFLDILGHLQCEAGDFEGACRSFEDAVAVTEKCSPEHRDLVRTLEHLGLAYHKAGEKRLAEHTFNKALQHRQKMMGDNHPSVLAATRNLAVVTASKHLGK